MDGSDNWMEFLRRRLMRRKWSHDITASQFARLFEIQEKLSRKSYRKTKGENEGRGGRSEERG